MNIPLLTQLAHLIEEVLKADAPVVEQAATSAAVESVEADPKVQAVTLASAELLEAAKKLKTAVSNPTPPPTA